MGQEKQHKPITGIIRDSVTNPETGEKRVPYARIPVRLTPQWLAKAHAEKAMRERYGAEPGKYDDIHAAVFNEIMMDYLGGFAIGYERGYFDERQIRLVQSKT